MCSIIISNHQLKDIPLIIAANRDEDPKRPSSKVQILAKEPHLIIGGKDEKNGGTWLGVNKKSLFAAITNQGNKKPKSKSRGEIVLNILKCSSLEEMFKFLHNLNLKSYSEFNLVFGNQDKVFIAHSYLLNSIVINEIPKGIHLITSDMQFRENAKTSYLHKRLDSISDMPWLEYYGVLKKILASSNNGFKLRIRKNDEGKAIGFCTKSSSVLVFSSEGLIRYKFYDRMEPRPKRKEGDPFIPKYTDYIDLWREVGNKETISEEIETDNEVDDDFPPNFSPKSIINELLSRKKIK